MRVSTDVPNASEPAPTGRTVVLADGAVDAMGTSYAPGALLVDNHRIVAVGSPANIGSVDDATRIELPGHVLLPGLVNAHSHLDLSGDGPMPPDTNFRRWLAGVRQRRQASTATKRVAATQQGVRLARAGGTVAVGDIVGQDAEDALGVLMTRCGADPGLRGVAFVELFGIGKQQQLAIEHIDRLVQQSSKLAQTAAGQSRCPHASNGHPRMQLGCSPHAPYSCGIDVYAAASACGLPIATHLAESASELELLQHGTGPMRDLLVEDIGLPEAAVPTLLSHPVQALAHTLHGALCVHLNCIEPSHADMLASIDAVACVCPRATVYFGRALPGPVAMLREAGVRIALGTDAMLCLDTPNRISVLDEMRLLSQCNAAPALELLAMATINGAEALGLDPSLVDLRPGPTAGVIALPFEGPSCSASTAMERVLASCSAPTWVVPPT